MTQSYWHNIQRHWALLSQPQRPNSEVVAVIKEQLASTADNVLLLGVTPELADIGRTTTAIDRSEAMIQYIWPGNNAQRNVHLGDWRNLPFNTSEFSGCVGDGSFNTLAFPNDITSVLKGVAKVVRPGGRCVFRLFAAPDTGESIEEVRALTFEGKIKSFHALKWRLAMAIVRGREGSPNVRLTEILSAFEQLFPNRSELSSRLGWDRALIDTVEVYRNSADSYCFPTQAQFLSLVPAEFTTPRIVNSGTYELAERCPLVVMDRAA